MAEMGYKLLIAVSGYSKVSKKLEKLMAVVKRPLIPARQSAVWLAGETLRVFSEGGRPEKWAPLSMMTMFIRAHREGAKNRTALPMNDTGRLKGSFIPVVTDDGVMFGASTNVEYASTMQYGGISQPNDVSIAAFTRRNKPKTTKGKSIAKATSRVKAYVMHMKGGNQIPPRPFFPEGIRELGAWGYHSMIKRIFADYFNNTNFDGGAA